MDDGVVFGTSKKRKKALKWTSTYFVEEEKGAGPYRDNGTQEWTLISRSSYPITSENTVFFADISCEKALFEE